MSDSVDPVHRSFTTFLAGLEGGRVHADLSTAIRDMVAELHDTRQNQGGKPKGKLVLSFDFRLDSDVIEITTDVKLTLPKQVRGKTVMYATPDNHLTSRNPRQQEFGFRDANEIRTEVRTAT
jgi:hypothetical protein